jgi:hypothetical protein
MLAAHRVLQADIHIAVAFDGKCPVACEYLVLYYRDTKFVKQTDLAENVYSSTRVNRVLATSPLAKAAGMIANKR